MAVKSVAFVVERRGPIDGERCSSGFLRDCGTVNGGSRVEVGFDVLNIAVTKKFGQGTEDSKRSRGQKKWVSNAVLHHIEVLYTHSMGWPSKT